MIFLFWLRTGSNPADINRFRGHIGKQNKLLSVKTRLTTSIISEAQNYPEK